MTSKTLLLVTTALLFPACAQLISSNRMMMAPALAPDCALQLVQADMMELSPMGTTWDMLGTVSVGANNTLDAASEELRALVGPKACELGGTAVALMQSANASSSLGGRSGAVIFAVLRPKTAPAAPKPAPMVELKTPEQQARVERMLSYIPPRFEALKEMLRKGPSPCSRDWVVLQPEIEAAAEQPNGDLMLTLGKGRLKVRLRCEGDFH